jgi:uncharacterized protein (TIGR03435 family)
MICRSIVLLTLAVCPFLFAATEFEVVSIRPMAPVTQGETIGLPRGGPGSPDPEHYVNRGAALSTIFRTAFGVENFQVIGPDWIGTDFAKIIRFDIVAKVPPGTSRDDFGLMFQSMLKQRFGLVYHEEMREFPVYELRVAKDGPKLKAATDEKLRGIRVAPLPGGAFRASSEAGDMASFALMMRFPVGMTVIDRTGLTGYYQFNIEYTVGLPAESDASTLPSVFTVLKESLGLELVKAKSPFRTIIVDNINKVPTEN